MNSDIVMDLDQPAPNSGRQMPGPTPPGEQPSGEATPPPAATLSVPGAPEGGKEGEGGTVVPFPAPTAPPLPPLPPSTATASRIAPAERGRGTPGEVFVPAPSENPVLAALRQQGLYRRSLGGGRHEVECPWAHEHGDGGGVLAIYTEPVESSPAGTFTCPHAHAEPPHVRDLLNQLAIDPMAARCKPLIKLLAGEMGQVIDWSEKVLMGVGGFYQSGGSIVSVRVNATSGDVLTESATEQTLTRALSLASDWEKYDGRSGKWVRCDPQQRYVQMLLKAKNYKHLDQLEGLARQPYFRADGSTVTEAGYDAAAKVFGVFDTRAYDLPEPTEEAARASLTALKGLLEEFPFANDTDRSATVSMMLTAAVRGSLPFAPAFNITASGPGSGKSYLASLIALFAGPGEPMSISYPITQEEAVKALLAALIPKPAVVLFDDMQTDWKPHGMMNKVLTSRSVTDRLLGSNRTQTVSTASLFMGTGNNIAPERDMRRRVVTVYLASKEETPATVSYANRPVDLVRNDRERYVGHALTIIRAWITAGRPKAPVPNIATYGDDWSDLCRQPLLWLGDPDPASSLIQQVTADPDKDALGVFLEAWFNEFGSRPMMVRKLVEAAGTTAGDDLHDALAELPLVMERDKVNPSKLGWYLKRNENRIARGLKVVKAEISERNGWSVVPVDGRPDDGADRPERTVEGMWHPKPKQVGPKIDPNDTF